MNEFEGIITRFISLYRWELKGKYDSRLCWIFGEGFYSYSECVLNLNEYCEKNNLTVINIEHLLQDKDAEWR